VAIGLGFQDRREFGHADSMKTLYVETLTNIYQSESTFQRACLVLRLGIDETENTSASPCV